MIVKNLTSGVLYLGWIGIIGININSGGTKEIDDKYALDDRFKSLISRGLVEVINFDSSDYSTVVQKELNDITITGTQGEVLDFVYFGGFNNSQSDIEVYEENGFLQRVTLSKPGSIIMSVVKMSGDRIAGSLVVEPTINGVKTDPALLDLALNNINLSYDSASTGIGVFNFNSGDSLGVRLSSSVDWAPNNKDIYIKIYVVF